jgi:hypothetical protein
VTGKWAVGQDAEELLNLDNEDEEEVGTGSSSMKQWRFISSIIKCIMTLKPCNRKLEIQKYKYIN